RKDYYYDYLSYQKSTKWVTAGKSDKVCAATYAVQTEAVRIVNPMPVMPTTMDAQKIPVCDGATVNLAAKNIDNSPAKPDGTTWTYRWFKDATAVAPAFGQAPATSDGYSFTAVHGGTPGAANKTIVKNSYTLKVYATTAGGCVDSALLNNAVAVEITPAPYADKPVVTSTGTETDADGKPYVCEGKTATLTLQNSPLPNNGTGLSYQWYKVGADGTSRTALTVGDVYKGVNTATLTVTGKETDQNGVELAGKYVLVVTVKMSNENCEGEVVSDAFEIGFSESPEVRITNGSATDFTLCPDEDTELAVKLDDATTAEIAAGTATVTYQWYKGGKTAAVSGATGATLKVKSTDVGTPSGSDITAQYYVKVTKLKKGYNCPTDVWSDAAVATAGNGGIGKAFTVKVRANCDPEAIVDKDAPTVALTSEAAVAICSANVDPGKTFMLKTSDGRLEVSKATWYYAPVTEDASGKLLMGAIKDGKVCTNIAAGATACPFSTKTDGGMLAAGEWRLWVDVERNGANKATTDTIHFVIRPNPTLANNPKAIMTKAGETTEVPDNLVCQGTSIDLKLDAAAVLNTLTDSKDKTETRTETTTHAWVCTNCGDGVVLATTPVYTYEAPKSRQPVTTAGAPAAARYEGNYTLTEKYVRTYQRTAAPTYNIGCAVWDDAKKDTLKKQFAVNVFTSLTPAGTLADADNKTAAAYCTADLDGASLQLVFTPKAGTEGTPQAKVTVWEYNVDGGKWQTWATVASGATAPNSLTVALDDAKLVQPAAGAVKPYQFRAQVANGPCDATIGTYTLSVYGALKAGTLTVPGAVCVGTSNTNISVTASGFEPADATIHFSLYETDPSAGGVSELLGDDVVGKSASASKNFALTTTPTAPTKYYVRYQVKNPQAASPCDELYSDVQEVTVYPSGEISHTGDNGREVCFENGTEVTFPLTQKNTTGFDVYAFDAPKTDAELKAGVIAGSLTPVASGTATATDVKITYDASASTPAMYQTQTYYYFVAKTGMYAVDKNAACALSIAQTNIKTINPLSAAVLAWDNPQSPSTATDLVIDKGRSNKITLTGGEHQRVDRAEIAATLHYAPDNGSGSPDMSKEQTKDNFISGYSYQFTETGIWYFWVVVDGTPCDDVTSNTIKATVNQSSELLLTGEQDICSDGDIKLEVEVEDDNTADVVASSVKWSYGSSDQGPWTALTAGTSANGTVTIASASPFTMTWTGHGVGQSAATARYFKMTYGPTGGSNKETPPYTVTVHPKPALSSPDALNLPAATCDQVAFDIKLADGVTATSASIAGIKWTLQFTQQDPASAQESDWTSKSRDAGGDVLHHALNLTDSGYYRLRIDGNKVCPSVTSNAALLTVNSKPEAGTLSMDPATACFNGDAEIKLTGYKGKITGYEYHPLRDRADQVNIGDTVWRSVLSPSAAFPLNLSGLSDPMPAGGYPDTWTWKNATHGYSLRAIVSNGACTYAVTSMKIQIYDTIKVSKDPVDFPVLVDEDGYPSEDVKFSAAAVTAGLKYVNGTALTSWTAADLSYQWRVSFDKGATWRDLGGSVSGQTTPSVTIEPAYFTAVVKDGSIAAANLGDMRFRCLVKTAKCNHEVRTASAVFTPQTTLHAGTIEPEGTASGCFYYGDTMILYHDGAVGLGTVNHHWRINLKGNLDHTAANFVTLDDAGIKYRYGTKNGAEDRSRIYISTAEKDLAGYWKGKTIHVFVTDDKHTQADWFDATSGVAVESLFAEWEICLKPKPVWTMKNDTICDKDASAAFTMEPNADLTGVTITKMVFDVTPVDHTSTPGIVSLDKMTGSCEYVADGSQKLNAVLDNATKRTMTLNRDGDRFHELYDSMVVKAVVGTDCSQKDETVYAVLRIDRGVKSLTTQQAELTVCEDGSVDLEAAIERYSSTIPSEIKWKWQRRATSGDASTDKDAGEANKFTGKTTKGVPDPVKLTLNPVKPTDSGIWVLKTETECGEAREWQFKLKVNVKPTWKDDLTVGDDDICAGATALNLAAALHVNWEPEIQWERSKTGADGSWTPLVTDGTMTVKADYDTPGQAKLSLDIVPTYLSDSAYYLIAVKAPAGSACADFALYSATRYVHIDTTPQ
ncbi:MAG: hypothetical protein K2H70_03380, partial [Bacteroidales bacterium]|nr:hypothetical protein [Bacteroidales bacterium]